MSPSINLDNAMPDRSGKSLEIVTKIVESLFYTTRYILYDKMLASILDSVA